MRASIHRLKRNILFEQVDLDVRVNVNVDVLVLVDVDGFIHEGLEQIHRGLRLGF
jgi:hypothetical protein